MRLVRIDNRGESALAVERETGRHPVGLQGGSGVAGVLALLRLAPAERQRAIAAVSPGPTPTDDRLLPPRSPRNIVAIGLNYADHIRETGMDAPQRPVVFSKLTSSLIGPGEEIRIDASLVPGDVVETEVEGIGTLRNTVAAA